MLEQIKPEIRSRVEPVVTKWTGFAQKLEARIGEVLAEADAGLDALIAQHATDHGPMGAAFSAVQARFQGLHPKLDDAFEKIEEQYDEAVEDADLNEQDLRAVYDVRDELIRQRQRLADSLELAYEDLQKRKNADWARRLQQLAEQERQKGIACSQCGGPMQVEVYWQSSQVPCGHCSAVNDVSPGLAAGLFYQGLGVHALAHEAAWTEWMAERQARERFHAYRHQTQPDFDAYLNAARAYWTKYYQVGKQLYPALCDDVGQAVEAKLRHYTAWDPHIDRIQRDFFAQLVAAARAGDFDTVRRLASGAPGGIDHTECAECLAERGLVDGTIAVLDAQYDAADEDEPRSQWIAEQLAEIRRTVS